MLKTNTDVRAGEAEPFIPYASQADAPAEIKELL